MWGEHGPRPEPLAANADAFGQWSVEEVIDVRCSAADAWALITDVTRIGEFSPECATAAWTVGDSAAVGNRFDGTNRVVVELEGTTYESTWTRPCTVTACVENEVFAYSVGDRYDGSPASHWEFRLESTSSGCRVTQVFRHDRDGLSGIRLQADADPARASEIIADRTAGIAAGMRSTLGAMKSVLEGDRGDAEAPSGLAR